MEIIPVIDVRHGVAVRAVAGDRARLPAARDAAGRQRRSGRCRHGVPVALYPFRTLYVADLDGIEGRGAEAIWSCALRRPTHGLDLWVDDGSGSCRISRCRERL